MSDDKKIDNKKVDINEKIECFVIMPISNQLGYEDNHFTLVYEDIIKPSIVNNNMNPVRADETKNTNLIHLDILKKVIQTPIAICDMSSKNPNVFYELGMRQAFDMPTVLLIDEETKPPFDISGLRYVTYNKDMSYRNVTKAIENLTSALKETFEKKDDKTEINSLIRLMELTTAKIETTNISKSEKIELMQEFELREIKNTIKQIADMQKSIITNINFDYHKDILSKNDSFLCTNKYISLGETLYLDGEEVGIVHSIGPREIKLKKYNGQFMYISKNSPTYAKLVNVPF
ncbi:hypothetical protein PJV93_03090 [Aliarcobacter butzleri]|uniref:Uncharacterized protein n=1 Tax=Aliarcobacter butzleri TaxID=28197 RepID=A0AAW7Q8U6_9BACT|nr:hypothetical protein [Aliarcobacter butzleri]MDN5107562.1 hypothetical protein [Aliarcobacter butzleri]MDN5122886.1 hypothetical protein [Aliarcobacter butzleri]